MLGEVSRREASNPITFGNAFQLLVDRGILVQPPPEGRERRREPAYARGPQFESLSGLRQQVAAALGTR